MLFVNKNKELQKKMKYCKKKRSFANKNKELQNINEAEQKQWFCNTYFPWPYLLIYLQRCFYFAFQSSLSLPYRFPLCASRFCGSHFVALFWHGGGVKGRGRVQKAWARPLEVTQSARDADHCISLYHIIDHCICVLAAFAQVKEVVNMNICCLFLSMCTLL